MSTDSNRTFYSNIDWVLIFIYFALTIGGIISIFSVLYEGGGELPARFINQIIWFCVSITVGLIILLVNSKYIFIYSYLFYFIMLLIMVYVAFFGKEVKGARSWISIAGFTLQPVEFMKIATSLVLARYMSSYSFDMNRLRDFITMSALIAAPILIIIFLQNDTGSAMVFGGLLLMLYREGLSKWIYIAGITMIGIFIAFFLLDPFVIFSLIIIITTILNGLKYGELILKLKYLVVLYALYIISYFFFSNEDGGVEPYILLIISFAATLPFIIYYISRKSGFSVLKYTAYIISVILYYVSVSYVFNNIMQLHQRKRVLDLLGIENDIYKWGYNVNQSKIAIGSGGLFGKGYLNGTQTKYNFVPEQSTDFIFCTVSEEFGFLGSFTVILLFTVLVLRLMRIGDKVFDAHSRIYCYCAASIFLFHAVINIGMTVGLSPVIGIPLPFYSYGGSSLLAFTILLSIALKLNMDNFEKK